MTQTPPLLQPYYADDLITIYNGDSREMLPHLTADVMVTDPPYGYAYASNWTKGDWRSEQIANDDDTGCRDDILEAWTGPALMFGSWKRARPESTRNVLIWDKETGPGMGDLAMPWGNGWEEIYVIGDGFAGRRESGVLREKRDAPGAMVHPNEKPIRLMRRLIAKCPPGVIIDPFMGSGSTLRAAKDLGRHCIGIELDEKWCALAVRRMAQESLFTADDALDAPPETIPMMMPDASSDLF